MLDPGPVFRPPPLLLTVAAGLEEFEECGIADVVALDRERRNVCDTRRPLVVPAERDRLTIDAQRGGSARHIHEFRLRHASIDARLVACGLSFLIERQPVPHIQQRFLVHRFVLEDREHGFALIQQWMSGTIEFLMFEHIEHTAVGLLDEGTNRFATRPIVESIRRRVAGLGRIDPSSEEPFESFVDTRLSERSLHERVEAKRRQVSVVEDDRMTKRDRLAEIHVVDQEIEQRA